LFNQRWCLALNVVSHRLQIYGVLAVKSAGANATDMGGIRSACDLAIVLLESTMLAAGRILLGARLRRCLSDIRQPAIHNGGHQAPKQLSNERFLVSVEKLQHMRPNKIKMCSNNFND
jgi:hypothetical protein